MLIPQLMTLNREPAAPVFSAYIYVRQRNRTLGIPNIDVLQRRHQIRRLFAMVREQEQTQLLSRRAASEYGHGGTSYRTKQKRWGGGKPKYQRANIPACFLPSVRNLHLSRPHGMKVESVCFAGQVLRKRSRLLGFLKQPQPHPATLQPRTGRHLQSRCESTRKCVSCFSVSTWSISPVAVLLPLLLTLVWLSSTGHQNRS
ncbi:uncharacterized protein LY79DRAFT_73038 [Colletotrichum navitas]|uniref:Uncharacterized protein n=1 Tax=Colletotrichum navitas TaxID=681940 RepID=A0AAD8Q650_9PEZI|nr:uncharacterized protein LY79DRAFT_73038 [Colletotrichum navitas]KAK1595976.1 hypothetical protein LY79DRAFT_73038 [Colletotrichum navitas]